MNRIRLLICVMAVLLTTMVGVAQGEDGSGCRRVHAIGAGQDLGGGNTTATISHGGVLNGTTRAHFDITGGAPPALTIAGSLVLTTKHGGLSVDLGGTLNVSSGEFTYSGPITDATGKLAGSTGTLTLNGVEDLSTGAFTETITGTLCRGEDDDD